MAKYSELDGYVFDEQSNVGWGLTLKMADKAPAVAKRIFDTYEHALAYVNDVKDSAIEGLVLSVVDDGDNNGVYFVQSVGKKSEVEGDENINGVLVKLGSADAASDGAADALTQAKAYTDQEVKELADGAVKTNTEAIATLNGDAETDGSIAKAVATETARAEAAESGLTTAIEAETEARENAIAALDANVDSTGGSHVTVNVTEVDGVITSVTVTESDIASAAVLAEVKEDVDNFFKDADFAENAKDTLKELQEYINTDAAGALAMSEAIANNKTAIEAEVARAEAAESGLTDAIAAETAARTKAISDLDATISGASSHVTVKITEENGKLTSLNITESDIASASATTAAINNRSQIVDVTNLFTKYGDKYGELSGYTMQQLANSHLVYKYESEDGGVSINGTPYVQVSMVAGSPSNSTMVIDDTTTMPTFGSHFTLIFEIYSEQDDKYILTQYLARVENTGMTSNVWTTISVEHHILATQDSIDTLNTTLTNKVNTKQDIIDNLETIESGAALGATSVQMIDVTSLFTEGNSMTGYTLSDLTTNKLYHSNGNTVKYVGYGDSAISANTNEANLVMESFEGAVRNIAIAHIIFDGSTLTTDSVKTYSSNVFVMRVSQVDYDTMKAAGTLDENTLYVIAEITE